MTKETEIHDHKHQHVTGWRRLIGCLKLQVILRHSTTNYRAVLRKMTYEDKASYDSTLTSTHIPHTDSPIGEIWREKIKKTCMETKKNYTYDQRQLPEVDSPNREMWGEVGGWGRVPFSRNFMSPTPRRKWYSTTGRRAH